MHPYAEGSKQGATLLARNAIANPRKVLLDLIEAHPNYSKARLFERFRHLVEDDDDLRMEVEWYFFNNCYGKAMQVKRNGNGCHKSRIEEAANAIVRQIVVLDLMMPNGKKMRDCTGPEMRRFGTRFTAIADAVGRKKVGDVLDDEKARKILKMPA